MQPDNGLVKTSLSTAIYKYDAAFLCGNKYAECVMDEISEIWGKMVYSDTTTLWETEKGSSDFSNAGSLCHGWSAVPLYVLYRHIVGFYPQSPGFRNYELQPLLTKNINLFQAKLYTPNGVVEFDTNKIIAQT